MAALIRAVICILAGLLGTDSRRVPIPDLSTGNVDGKVGLLFWPSTMAASADQRGQPLATAAGCEVHLVPETNLDRELRYACGQWFAPPADRYRYWLERRGEMTPTWAVLIYNGDPFRGRGMGGIVPVAPAGPVGIPAERAIASHESIRVVSTRATHSRSKTWWIFDRRIATRDARSPVQMPEGSAVMGRFDRRTNDAIALSRPFDVKAGRAVSVWPEPPVASDVLVVLDKPVATQTLKNPGATRLKLNDGNRQRPADVVIDATNRMIAIWYEVDARRATISVESDVMFWAPREVQLVRGKVTTVRAQAAPLPTVKVSVNAPADAPLPEEMPLEVTRAGRDESVRRATVKDGAQELPALPADALRFTLTLGEWKVHEDVDLSSGQDAAVIFDLQPLVVRGTVYYGDEPTRARVSFLNGDAWPAVETNDRGFYETTLWWPDVYTARVTLAGRNGPPFLDAFREIFDSGTVDFHVPGTDYRVRVRDKTNGKGIEGARVLVGSLWKDESGGSRRETQRVVTDASGLALLPPLRTGELVVDVQADRYARGEPLRAVVDDPRRELDIWLEPLPATGQLRLLLPNGSPAAHAEVWALDAALKALWRGSFDGEGVLEVPTIAEGALLLLRHPDGASTVRRWPSSDRSVTWSLGTPAEPLTVVAEELSRDPAQGAHVVLWLDGIKLSGPALALATWSVPMTDQNGAWVGRNLPMGSLRLLVVGRDRYDAIATTAFDTVSRQIEYPWSGRVVFPITGQK